MKNLELWSAVEKTPPSETKPITGKPYSGTSPKPHYIIRKATETFGPCGIGWGFTFAERVEEGAEGEKLHIAHVKVWYEWNGKRGEIEHVGQTMFSGTRVSGKPYTDEDAPKKSVTDGLIKALSMIGFAGDIFGGRYDDSKYVNELRREEREAKEPAATPQPTEAERLIAMVNKATTVKELNDWLSREPIRRIIEGLSDEDTMRFNSAKATQEMNLGA